MGTLLYSKITDQLKEIFLSPQESKGYYYSMGPYRKKHGLVRNFFCHCMSDLRANTPEHMACARHLSEPL